MKECIAKQSLASFIKEYFIKPPSSLEVSCAIKTILLGKSLKGENIKNNSKE